MKIKIPPPVSGGLIISYKCNSGCIHCLYNCGNEWNEWIDVKDAERYLKLLKSTGTFRSLHITGGEPFMNFNLLCEIARICKKTGIPTFVETNCFWAVDDEKTERKLKEIKKSGIESILISCSPFYLEKIPFENFKRCLRISEDVFGKENVMVYTREGCDWIESIGIKGKISFHDFIKKVPHERFIKFLKNYIVPKGKCLYTLENFFYKYPAEKFLKQNCIADFLNPYHIHVDLYGNYITSFCGGISIGKIEEVLRDGIDFDRKIILKMLSRNIGEFLQWAEKLGYKRKDGYINKCHICLDIRRYLVVEKNMEFEELQPAGFYKRLP